MITHSEPAGSDSCCLMLPFWESTSLSQSLFLVGLCGLVLSRLVLIVTQMLQKRTTVVTHRASSQRIIEGAGVVTVHSFKADVGNDPHLTSWWNGILSNSLERPSLVQTNMFGIFWHLGFPGSQPIRSNHWNQGARLMAHAPISTKLPSFTVRQGIRPVVVRRLRSARRRSCQMAAAGGLAVDFGEKGSNPLC